MSASGLGGGAVVLPTTECCCCCRPLQSVLLCIVFCSCASGRPGPGGREPFGLSSGVAWSGRVDLSSATPPSRLMRKYARTLPGGSDPVEQSKTIERRRAFPRFGRWPLRSCACSLVNHRTCQCARTPSPSLSLSFFLFLRVVFFSFSSCWCGFRNGFVPRFPAKGVGRRGDNAAHTPTTPSMLSLSLWRPE